MNNLKALYEKVKESKEFKGWQSNNKKSYLCSFFMILGDKENHHWQLDFYNPAKDAITSFLASDPIQLLEKDSKIFKSDKSKLNELNLDKIEIDFDEAIRLVEKVKIEKYPRENPTKKIIILQKTNKILWNITYLTTSLNILNLKIDASNGDILEEKFSTILSLNEQ